MSWTEESLAMSLPNLPSKPAEQGPTPAVLDCPAAATMLLKLADGPINGVTFHDYLHSIMVYCWRRGHQETVYWVGDAIREMNEKQATDACGLQLGQLPNPFDAYPFGGDGDEPATE